MPIKIFVGRIQEGTSREDILTLFRKYGEVAECDVISNYGFVHMTSEDEANAAIDALDGFNVNGSRIHVELSTARTQGRKRKSLEGGPPRGNGGGGRGGGGRFEPYPSRRDSNNGDPGYRLSSVGGPPPDRGQRDEYASEQVKDLLELYFRDPIAFDQYAKTYYYGERLERAARTAKRPPDGPPSTSRRAADFPSRAGQYTKLNYPSDPGDKSYDSRPRQSDSVGYSSRDDRGRGSNSYSTYK